MAPRSPNIYLEKTAQNGCKFSWQPFLPLACLHIQRMFPHLACLWRVMHHHALAACFLVVVYRELASQSQHSLATNRHRSQIWGPFYFSQILVCSRPDRHRIHVPALLAFPLHNMKYQPRTRTLAYVGHDQYPARPWSRPGIATTQP